MFDRFISGCVSILPKKLQKLYYKYEDAMLYIFFGVLTTLVSLVTQFLSAYFLGKEGVFAVTTCTVISNVCAVTFAFFTNKKYVFKSETKTKKEFWKQFTAFYSARAVSFFIDLGIMLLFANYLKLNYYAVKIIAQFVILASNYLFSKLIVFKNKD